MPLTMASLKRRVDLLALIGGILILIDTIWGGVATLGLDLNRTNELVMGISFVLGLPLYLLDLCMSTRVAVAILGLFFFRWVATCFGGPTPVLCNPLRGSILLLSAFVLLQVSKVRRGGELRRTGRA